MASGETGYRDLTLDAFAARLASAEPVPGGGSASAVAASLAASLLEMVSGLSRDRPRYATFTQTITRAAEVGRQARTRFLELADQDAAAYAALSAALRMPRESEAERADRQRAIGSAARVAADVPLAMVRECATLVAAVETLAGRSNVNASSDLNVAALIAEAAARGAGANVIVNLPMLPDGGAAGAMTAQVTGLLHDIAEMVARIRETVMAGGLRDPEPDGR